ncbi:hypothetical protein [Paenibacillus sp. MMS20-IR301]|uniref:hypothetical protein n=1 Tax=Paenibacillus sp. MMS20-IR301 TaxID=2895946 RepID=UPI0028EE1FDB|nr:hypothetical protein [Paenibacillus sp. MMS20-IR301]WNS45683.1 hypothetical protein LOS79_10560 [Paenibacillus sp. MMS20-IR301]
MSMSVHNLMAFNHQFFRPQPVLNPKPQRTDDKTQSFQDVLNEKLKAYSDLRTK